MLLTPATGRVPVGAASKAGSSLSARSIALSRSSSSPLRSCAAARPPSRRMTVSKKEALPPRSKSSCSATQERPLRSEEA